MDYTQFNIKRVGSPKNFKYTRFGKPITNKNVLLRISKLRIPPNWEMYWLLILKPIIFRLWVGIRKIVQYIYHPMWVS